MNVNTTASLVLAAAVSAIVPAGLGAQTLTPPATLAPTNHPRLPRDLSQLWLAPESRGSRTVAQNELITAVRLEVTGNFAKALPLLTSPTLRQGPLAQYATYYAGLAHLRLGRPEEARRTFETIPVNDSTGYLAEAIAFREAECADATGDHAAEVAVFERLLKSKTIYTEEVLMRLAHAAKLAGDGERATQAYARVYYEYPLSDQALAAGAELAGGGQGLGPSRFKLGLERAERLFNAKRYGQARVEFDALHASAAGDDRELVELRVAECDYFLKRARIAKTALRPYIDHASRQGEALFFYALSSRELNEFDDYLKIVNRIAVDFPSQTWADDALNDLATYYIQQDEDAKADEVFRNLYRRFPTGHNAERAAWKIGWWAYKNRNDADATLVFEQAAADFPRSDYRPMYLYWAGRAHDRLKDTDLAIARYTLAVTDYSNSYYGRLAVKRLDEHGVRLPQRRLIVDASPEVNEAGVDAAPLAPAQPPPTAAVIRALLALDLYDQAIDELHYAQKAWGNSSLIEATLAWTYWQQGRALSGSDQFSLYRSAINAMKRAYPHYLAAGGEDLPGPLLRIIFPVAYWDAIRKYAAAYHVDPYVSAALIAQESTFVPDIRSYANAWGLTQLLPSTAKQYAKVLKLKYTPKLLTDPDANLRMGTAYFADKIREFGSVPLALASYNAGERPVHRWTTERPGIPEDEFIDDIPYPQTNNYVKKILGTAEDYRRLYAGGLEASPPAPAVSAAKDDVPPKASAAPKGGKRAVITKRSSRRKARKAA